MGTDPNNPEVIDTKIQQAFMQVDIRTKIHYCFYGEHQFNGMPWDNPMWHIPDVSYEPKEQHFATYWYHEVHELVLNAVWNCRE